MQLFKWVSKFNNFVVASFNKVGDSLMDFSNFSLASEAKNICYRYSASPLTLFRQDFYRQFGPRCAGCQLVFSETEKVRKIDQSFFHGHCFKCKDCSKDLSEAEKVGCDQNGNLLCEADFLKNHCDENENDRGHSGLDDCEEGGRKDENSQPHRDLAEGNNSEEEQDLNKEVMDDPKNKRKRGPKTTIKPHQLEILKNCFDQNPKPTPKVFEELSKDTGLSKRVIQVWFQNKRSKSKRINKMQSLISMGQSFPTPIPGLGFPPPHPAWDHCPDMGPGDYPGYPGPGAGHAFGDHHDRGGGFYSNGDDSLGYGGGGHFNSNNCFPSPPSQSSDYPCSPNTGPYPPPCSLPSFPSPVMEAGVPGGYSQD